MSGGQEIDLVIKAEKETAEEAFSAIEEIEKIEVSSGAEKGTAAVKLGARKDADIRESVFYQCARLELPILEMKPGGKSLEDIFLELTSENGNTAEENDGKEEEI